MSGVEESLQEEVRSLTPLSQEAKTDSVPPTPSLHYQPLTTDCPVLLITDRGEIFLQLHS